MEKREKREKHCEHHRVFFFFFQCNPTPSRPLNSTKPIILFEKLRQAVGEVIFTCVGEIPLAFVDVHGERVQYKRKTMLEKT